MRKTVAWGAVWGLVGGVVLGLIVWSGQTRLASRDLFSTRRMRRFAALGHISGRRSIPNVRLLRDYLAWEQHPGLHRRGSSILREMEQALLEE